MTLIASHRGGTHLWPENSRIAFRETARMPVAMVEFDVHQTSDHVLVVHHDATLDRMTDGSGPLGVRTFAELQQYVIIGAGGETVPTLAEVIDIFRPSSVDLRLEIKTATQGMAYPGMERRILEALERNQMVERTLLTSFSLERLVASTEAAAKLGIAITRLRGLMWLCSPTVVQQCGWTGVVAAMRACDIGEIGLRAETIDDAVMQRFAGEGIVVHAWAAHSTEAARRMFELGVASFTTDRPDLAVAARDLDRR